MPAPLELEDAISAFYQALNALFNGDSAPLKAVLSQRDDATAFLGWGGYERGWDELATRWDWAASQFAGGHVTAETITLGVEGALAYTVGLEHGSVRLIGPSDPGEPVTLRVTHIYRR